MAGAVEIIKNPSFAGFYLAGAALVAGFSERALHAAFMLPALLSVLGTYALARRFTSMPFLSALAALATPAFLVSATTLMCDVLMLAFWVWAVYFWVRGVDEDRWPFSLAGAVLIAFAATTKYFGVSLVPLLAAYSVLRGKKGLKQLAFLLVPVAAMAGYHLYTEAVYGAGLLLDASAYAALIAGNGAADPYEKAFVGLVFAGGSVITALFFLPSVWGLRALIPGAVFAGAGALYVYKKESIGLVSFSGPGFGWGYIAQLSVYASAGLGILLLAVRDLVKRRDADSALLALWVAGTLAFTAHINWTINARSVLPMAPAVAVLIMRAAADARPGRARLYLPLAFSFAVSFLVALADYNFANTAREAAHAVTKRYQAGSGTLWFQGHWGFQYYMESLGARAIDREKNLIRPGDTIVSPYNNSNIRSFNKELTTVVEELTYTPSRIMSTMALPGAGFYASEWGPAPFMLFPPDNERYWVIRPK